MKRYGVFVLVWCLTGCAEVKNTTKDGAQTPEVAVAEQSGETDSKAKPEKVQN